MNNFPRKIPFEVLFDDYPDDATVLIETEERHYCDAHPGEATSTYDWMNSRWLCARCVDNMNILAAISGTEIWRYTHQGRVLTG